MYSLMFYSQTILDDSNGSSQNSRSTGGGGSPLPATTLATNQLGNSNAATGISQNQTSESQLSPYFSSSTNAPTSAQAMLRTTLQIRQMVACQVSGQTVTMSATQASERTAECSIPVIQPAVPWNDRGSPLGQDMTWVSHDHCYYYSS